MVLSGKVQCSKQIVTISNDGGVIECDKTSFPKVQFFISILDAAWCDVIIITCYNPLNFGYWVQAKSGYTSTGESVSEVEDITSPKACGNSMNPILTHVQEEASDSTLITRLHKTKTLQRITNKYNCFYTRLGKICW